MTPRIRYSIITATALAALTAAFLASGLQWQHPQGVNALHVAYCAQEPNESASFQFFGSRVDEETKQLYLSASKKMRISSYRDTDHREILRLEGQFDDDTLPKLQSLYRSEHRIIEINSLGGYADSAMQVGDFIAQHKLTIKVAGICASACANYILPTAEQIYLAGIVGYHGDIGSCTAKRSIYENLKRWGIERTALMMFLSASEGDYYKRHAIDPTLAKQTLPMDRGMNDGQQYLEFIPTTSQLRRTLKPKITGEVDQALVKRLNAWTENPQGNGCFATPRVETPPAPTTAKPLT